MKVTNLGIKNSMLGQIRKNYGELAMTEKQLTTGKRYTKVSEKVPQAISSIYSRIRSNQINQHIKTAEDSQSTINVVHDKIDHMNQMMIRVKEITIQGANGVYGSQDRINMATEIEEILKEMVSQANSIHQENYLFSGSRKVAPFSVTYDLDTNLGNEVISSVEYNGDNYVQKREIDQQERVNTSLPGSEVFWGINNRIVSLKDNGDYVSPVDQKIKIDGYEVSIDQNDNLEKIIEKINQKVPSVVAFQQDLPGGEISLGIESRYPHKIFMEDIEGGRVLRDLGYLQEGPSGDVPPNNLHSNTLEQSGSVFDVLIDLRKSLIDNDITNIGSRDLEAVDSSIDTILKNQAKISSVQFRLDGIRKNLSTELVHMRERISKSEDMDIAEATVRFNEINSLHQLGLKATSKYVRPTLLDYL